MQIRWDHNDPRPLSYLLQVASKPRGSGPLAGHSGLISGVNLAGAMVALAINGKGEYGRI